MLLSVSPAVRILARVSTDPPKNLLSLCSPCVIAVLHWKVFIEDRYTSTELKPLYSPLKFSAAFTLRNHFLCQAPFSSKNPCWSPEVWWVYWQYLPGNVYLLVGKALFRALSNERREIHPAPTQKTPPTPHLHWAYCRQRTPLARMQTSAWALLGTWLPFELRSKDGFPTLLWCILLLSTFFNAKIYSGKYLQKPGKKIKTSESCCSELLITIHEVFMNKFIYYLSSSSTV